MKYAATQTADSTKIKKNIYEQRHLFEHTQPTNGVSFYMNSSCHGAYGSSMLAKLFRYKI